MKKIVLKTPKLILKKDVIGNLANSEMKFIIGGGPTNVEEYLNSREYDDSYENQTQYEITAYPGCPGPTDTSLECNNSFTCI